MININKTNDITEISVAYRLAVDADQAAYAASFGDYEASRPLMVETGRRLAAVQQVACHAGVWAAIVDLEGSRS